MAMFSLRMLHTVLLTVLCTLSAVEGEAVATFVEYPGNVKYPAEVVVLCPTHCHLLQLYVCIHIPYFLE